MSRFLSRQTPTFAKATVGRKVWATMIVKKKKAATPGLAGGLISTMEKLVRSELSVTWHGEWPPFYSLCNGDGRCHYHFFWLRWQWSHEPWPWRFRCRFQQVFGPGTFQAQTDRWVSDYRTSSLSPSSVQFFRFTSEFPSIERRFRYELFSFTVPHPLFLCHSEPSGEESLTNVRNSNKLRDPSSGDSGWHLLRMTCI